MHCSDIVFTESVNGQMDQQTDTDDRNTPQAYRQRGKNILKSICWKLLNFEVISNKSDTNKMKLI